MYLLFSGPIYGADHGWKSFTGGFASLSELETWLDQSIEEWAHVVKDYKIIKEYRRTEGGWEDYVGEDSA